MAIQMWQCERCGAVYNTRRAAEECEKGHFPSCSVCEHVYYVYGCEEECMYRNECIKNNYRKFKRKGHDNEVYSE